METAIYFDKPAVEPLSKILLNKVGPVVTQNHVKQFIGSAAKEILLARGYVQGKQRKCSSKDSIFLSATKYYEPVGADTRA